MHVDIHGFFFMSIHINSSLITLVLPCAVCLYGYLCVSSACNINIYKLGPSLPP